MLKRYDLALDNFKGLLRIFRLIFGSDEYPIIKRLILTINQTKKFV
jgi:hypothetical protein